MSILTTTKRAMALAGCLMMLLGAGPLAARQAFPDYDTATHRYGRSLFIFNSLYVKPTHDRHLLQRRKAKQEFKAIYDRNIAKFKEGYAPDKIPKVIHQIWLGSPVPARFKEWMASWAALQGWQYKLWTDKEVKQIKLYNQRLYDLAKDYGEKSDILRYEILYREGGVYVDVDYACANGALLEQMNKSYHFYAGFEPLEHRQPHIDSSLLGNAFLASCAGHPLLKKIIDDLDGHYRKNRQKWAVLATGPGYLTSKALEYIRQSEGGYTSIFLPPTFLYPISYRDAREHTGPSFEAFIKPETIAVHYWSGSWRKKK